jgi:hypothetical protein
VEREPLQPQEIEVDETPDIDEIEEQPVENEGWCSKSDGLLEDNYIEMPEIIPPPPVYLIDGVAHPTDKEPAGFHVTKGVKYANVDEALKHMANAEAPESMIIPYLQEKIKANEDWLAAALTKLTEMETGKLTELSDKVQALEKAAAKEEAIIKK